MSPLYQGKNVCKLGVRGQNSNLELLLYKCVCVCVCDIVLCPYVQNFVHTVYRDICGSSSELEFVMSERFVCETVSFFHADYNM